MKSDASIVSLADAKARAEKKRHAVLVLKLFDAAEHDDRRGQRDEAAKINQQAREKL